MDRNNYARSGLARTQMEGMAQMRMQMQEESRERGKIEKRLVENTRNSGTKCTYTSPRQKRLARRGEGGEAEASPLFAEGRIGFEATRTGSGHPEANYSRINSLTRIINQRKPRGPSNVHKVKMLFWYVETVVIYYVKRLF